MNIILSMINFGQNSQYKWKTQGYTIRDGMTQIELKVQLL